MFAAAIRSVISAALVAFEVFEEIGIEDWRADLVRAHCPFAEVDAAATVAAEGEIFVRGLDQLFAGRAMKRFDFGGFGHLVRSARLLLLFSQCRGDISSLTWEGVF
jgi:hypothetical protein